MAFSVGYKDLLWSPANRGLALSATVGDNHPVVFRPPITSAAIALLSLCAISCRVLLADVELEPAQAQASSLSTEQQDQDAAESRSSPAIDESLDVGPSSAEGSGNTLPIAEHFSPNDASLDLVARGSRGDAALEDAGPASTAPPVPSEPQQPRGVVASPPLQLEMVGSEEGGGARLGHCVGGVMVGVQPTANPSEEVFGQRLAFVEPICATLLQTEAGVALLQDDSTLLWDEADPFLGTPPTEVPDPRLVWTRQPRSVCPESAPVLIGLFGSLDAIAPDSPDTAAFRSLGIECAPLVTADAPSQLIASAAGHQRITLPDSFATEGDAAYSTGCSDGRVATTVLVRAGFWLDGIALGCSSLIIP